MTRESVRQHWSGITLVHWGTKQYLLCFTRHLQEDKLQYRHNEDYETTEYVITDHQHSRAQHGIRHRQKTLPQTRTYSLNPKHRESTEQGMPGHWSQVHSKHGEVVTRQTCARLADPRAQSVGTRMTGCRLYVHEPPRTLHTH